MPEFIVDKNISLFSFVKERSFGISYSRYAGYIKQNKIKVNRKKPKLTDKVDCKDYVALYFELRKPDIPVIYNDGYILVVNKPQGLASNGDYYYTAENVVAESFPTSKLCHRLDIGTSGLLIFALTNEVYDYILAIQSNFEYDKYYRTVVIGTKRENDLVFLTHHLKKDKLESRVSIYDKPVRGSQECRLVYRVIKKATSLSLLEIQLITGRTHQIRAQLKHVGLPILGDDKYGDHEKNKHHKIYWPLLQAFKLDFTKTKGDYPFCGRIITIDEPNLMKTLFSNNLP